MIHKDAKWAACLDSFKNPVTWGWITEMNESITFVSYATGAPIWCGNAWDNEYVKVFDTEKEAADMVRRFKESVVYDPH